MTVTVALKGKSKDQVIYDGVSAKFEPIPGTAILQLVVRGQDGKEMAAFLQTEVQGYTANSDTGGPHIV